jgi:serine/threonine protein kinase
MMACSGYWPPEYIKHQIISKEFDIFSLGVIIVKIMTGHEGYTCIADMTDCKFVKHVRTFLSFCHFQQSIFKKLEVIFYLLCYLILTSVPILEVHENWRNKLCQKLSHTSLEVYCNQVKRCIELALDCLKSNRQERPTMQDIVSSLNETEPMISDQGLQIEQVPSLCDRYVS